MSCNEREKLYPSLANGALQFRLKEIDKIRSQMESFFEEDEAIARKQQKKLDKKLVGALLGAGSVIAVKMEPRFLKKATKHDKLAALAEAKLLSFREKISKALNDGKVSDEEFDLLTDEMRKFELQRREILKGGMAPRKAPKNDESMRDLANAFAKFLSSKRKGSS